MNENLVDESLPIVLNKEGDGETQFGPSSTPRYTCFRGWTRNQKNLFYENQRILTSPVFGGKKKFRFRLAQDQRLPFLEEATGPEGNGFFGEVSKTLIHAKHIVGHEELPIIEWKPKESNLTTEWATLPAIQIAVKRLKRVEQLSEAQWEQLVKKETENLNRARELQSEHLIKPIAAYERKLDRCFIFRWADGGNLGDFWTNHEVSARDRETVLWLLGQFAGICSALKVLHEENVRHGDLKPENILLFKRGYEDKMGSLQIADLGLTTFHEKEQHTNVRMNKGTKTPSGTRRYEPPEMEALRGQERPRSRQYDIWSFGCILLELLVWLVSGNSALKTLRDETSDYFWRRVSRTDGSRSFEVSEYVVLVMRWLDEQLENGTAYKDMLQLVREKLLIVPVSGEYESILGHREIASKVHETLQGIHTKKHYSNWRKTRTTGSASDPQDKHRTNSIRDTDRGISARITGGTFENDCSSTNLELIQKSSKLNDDWTSVPDNDFAVDFFDRIGWEQAKPSSSNITPRLCDSCAVSNSQWRFDKFCDVAVLRERARACDLCELLQEALERKGIRPPLTVELRQDAARVGLESGPNLLSYYCEPGKIMPIDAQFGLPSLFSQASREFYALLKEWIRVCNTDHDMCRRDEKDIQGKPTRLIYIGQPLRLVEAAGIHSDHYVALSHCWGPLKEKEKFCAYKRNIEELKTNIDFDALPRTFQDAITVTRGLEIDYIWIDSLCIIQDDDDDWQRESAKMELVFSTAYCTIGASSAKSSVDGFLRERTPRTVLKLPETTAGATYVCADIDDFYTDVELSALNSRGWVLQERALSRRTIFFTSSQVYWECGAGIHCETLTRLENSKVALLGDANFPNAAIGHYRDGRQLLIQDLYERYSGLAFSKDADRSVAILGLEARLARTFRTKAAYGLFEGYFARGLLWKRRDWTHLERITQPGGRRVPSWSSLSRKGGIQYMDATTELRFKEIDWAIDDFRNPFSVSDGIESASFLGLARKINISKYEMLVIISFDDNEEFAVKDLRCVVIGRDKPGKGKVDLKHHVLIIHEARNVAGNGIFERVGVASLRPEVVASEGSWVTIY
ncbi:HET-domain-containing protein [Periconia macrospinosa]|uniref:HET-domain-containing protein n=1 Tax=Periconia macrospinosa TaxID=97972 RepID=A0A2V1D7Z1_9PLEO|nr:HET-domain-containing protein [Periconia macrospinosa]